MKTIKNHYYSIRAANMGITRFVQYLGTRYGFHNMEVIIKGLSDLISMHITTELIRNPCLFVIISVSWTSQVENDEQEILVSDISLAFTFSTLIPF